MAKYLIAGGTGFVGQYVIKVLLAQGHEIYVLTTQKNMLSTNQIQYIFWNPSVRFIDQKFSIKDVFVINLAGAGVADKRWTVERKQLIVDSRVDSLQTLFEANQSGQLQINHLVSASAIGIYGNGEKVFVESDEGDDSFLSVTCKEWESAALHFKLSNIEVAIARIGIVLGKESGALKEFLKPMRFGIAGIPASGEQIYSWIAVSDLANLLVFLSSKQHKGIYNAVATHPCSINTIFGALKSKYKIFLTANAPSWILKLMLGEMAIEVLKSANVSNKKILATGFKFQHESIDEFVEAL
jgi:uncharacterized protein